MKKGTLKIESLETRNMLFVPEDGSMATRFVGNSKDNISKWFCSSSRERALNGVPASYDEDKRILMTEEWDTQRRVNFLSGCDFQLSYRFC